MKFPFGETVTIERKSSTYDRYGKAGNSTPIVLRGVAFAPRNSVENNDQRTTVITGLTMYCEPGTVIRPTDIIVRANGDKYEVEGEPGYWRNPFTGTNFGTEVSLVRVTG